MGKCIEKLPHVTDKCNSKNGLQVFLGDNGKYNGYCFACNTVVPDPYGDQPEGYKPTIKVKSEEEVQQEIKEIQEYQTVDLPARKLKKQYLEYFNIKIGLSETDGVTPVTHYYPYTSNGSLRGYKVRLIENKQIWSVGDQKNVDLFGWEQAKVSGSKNLYITEGELDAVALFQILKDSAIGTPYADRNPAVVSIGHGAGAAGRDIARALPDIRKHFNGDIVLVFDQDDAGKKAEQDVIRIIPEAKVAALPFKDVNECLIKGHGNAARNAVLFRAEKPKNTRIVAAGDLHEAAKAQPEFGIPWPWKHITDKTRGIRFGETIYIGAGQKQGKSEVVNTLAAHFIKLGLKVFLAKPEESNNKTYKLVAGKMEGKIFHDPKVPFDEEAYDRAGELLKDNLFMLNLYQEISWEVLQGDIRAAANEGCKAIIIDPITNLTNGKEASKANEMLQEIAQKLAAMALDLGVVIFIFCHLRNPDSGPPHERGGEVLSSQFAGSRAMARSCNLMLGLEGNRDPNLSEDQKNLRTLVLLEDREFGETGRFPLYWDKNTQLFNELPVQK